MMHLENRGPPPDMYYLLTPSSWITLLGLLWVREVAFCA